MHLPAHALQTIPVTWPFTVWGLDLVGPLHKAPGGFTHLLVAIDKFSKWTGLETWRSYTLRIISSPCEDIKRREFGAETSTKGTWC